MKADPPFVVRKNIKLVIIFPTQLMGTLTPVIFLTIALTEGLLIEITDSIETIATDIHTEAYSRRYFDEFIFKRQGREQAIQCIDVKLRKEGIILTKMRKAADRRIIGKRCKASDPFMTIGS